jgi:UDP-glucose:tetrahydrobiopterin glucosyltransferase
VAFRILFIASAVGPFGSAETGGVSRFLLNSAKALEAAGHRVAAIAAEGGDAVGLDLQRVGGTPQPTASAAAKARDFVVPPDALLAAMLNEARRRQGEHDLIVNLNHDWLPYYLTSFFRTPLAHVANLGHSSDATDGEIAATSRRYPHRVAALTATQARLLAIETPVLVPFCMDLDAYRPGAGDGGYLAWAGRIAPEKGLHNAARIAAAAGLPLHVAGGIGDEPYWREVQACHPGTVRYLGFLTTEALQTMLGGAVALLQMQDWEEAFGGVTVEAMACGTPVVAYARGANIELVTDGVGGFLVTPGDDAAALAALARARTLDRAACRDAARASFGLERMRQAYADWFRLLKIADGAGIPPLAE